MNATKQYPNKVTINFMMDNGNEQLKVTMYARLGVTITCERQVEAYIKKWMAGDFYAEHKSENKMLPLTYGDGDNFIPFHRVKHFEVRYCFDGAVTPTNIPEDSVAYYSAGRKPW